MFLDLIFNEFRCGWGLDKFLGQEIVIENRLNKEWFVFEEWVFNQRLVIIRKLGGGQESFRQIGGFE